MSKRATLGGTGIFSAPEPAPPLPEQKAANDSGERANRVGKVLMPFWVTATAKKQLKIMAAVNDTTQQELMTEAMNDFFRKHGKPPIA